MIFTKTEIKVLELFVSEILNSFTIREVSRKIKKDLKIVHTSIKNLIKKQFLIKDKKGIRLNYKIHQKDLTYIENLRKEAFFKKNTLIKIYLNRFIQKAKNKFFILLIFGSYARNKTNKKSDIDILAIIPKEDGEFERQIKAELSISKLNFHINLIISESFTEMLHKRDELNIINETLNNHILVYGAEQYYALMGERDVR